MPTMKNLLLLCLLSALYACIHPLEIVGEGDILSATGTRDCYLEEFQTGEDNCSVNRVVYDYQETYYALPRAGWQFVAWENCYTGGAMADQCSFDFDASVVRKFWFATADPLVAVFEKDDPPAAPVAMYSYAIDDEGFLIDPLPLEGAHLERRAGYFTFTGDYERVNFWCCKVLDGEEGHGEKVEDRTPPFVLRVDLNSLPDDGGLERELYADLFTSATDYTGHSANWTLASPVVGPVVFDDGGSHLIDYNISTGIRVENGTSVTVAPGVTISGPGFAAEVSSGSFVTVNGGHIQGEIDVRSGSGIILHDGSIDKIFARDSPQGLNMTGGSLGQFGGIFGWMNVSGGEIGTANTFDGDAKISGGVIGTMIFAGSTSFVISGGRFENKLLVDGYSGGRIQGGAIIPNIEVLGGNAILGLIGELTLSEPIAIDRYPGYRMEVSGILQDGTPIETDIECTIVEHYPELSSCTKVSVSP